MIPARFCGRARRDAAAFYLSQLGKAMLHGEVSVQDGEHATTLATSEFVVMKIEIKEKKRAHHVDIKLSWLKRPLTRGDGDPRATA